MKSVWQGNIAFGLVTIPIKLYAAVSAQPTSFKLLCGACNHPVRYKRWCDHCNKEVQWSNIVKGLMIERGNYFVLSQEVVHELRPLTTKDLTITEFVLQDQLDPLYFDAHYYAVPTDSYKPYVLLQQILASSKKTAIGTLVMHEKEHVCALQSYKDAILLSTLHYSNEIRSIEKIDELAYKEPSIAPGELKLARQLIDQLTTRDFDIRQYKDTFAQKVRALVKQRKKGKMIRVSELAPAKLPKMKKKPTLMHMLEESLERPKKKTRK